MDERGLRIGVSRAVSYWRHFVTGQTGERIATLRRIVCRERCVGGFRCVGHCHGENDRLAASRRDAEGDCRCLPDAGLANADRARDDLDEIEAARISGRASVVWLEDDCRGLGDSPRQGARGGVRGVFWESRRRANSGLDGVARVFGWDPRQDVRWRVRSADPALLRNTGFPAGRPRSDCGRAGNGFRRSGAKGRCSRGRFSLPGAGRPGVPPSGAKRVGGFLGPGFHARFRPKSRRWPKFAAGRFTNSRRGGDRCAWGGSWGSSHFVGRGSLREGGPAAG